MKTFIAALLISVSAFANDCSVSILEFESGQEKIESILESKGYVINNENPRYKIVTANYFGHHGEITKVVNMFERGNDNRIHSVTKKVSPIGTLIGGFKKIEKRFINSLPECF